MSMNLSPQFPDVTVFKGNGGAYYSWSDDKFPFLGEANLGAGKLVLGPRCFALPHYADCYKIGYVVQGICRVGMVLQDTTKETVLTIKKGDAIPVPLGSVSWWYNPGEEPDDVVISFLGETSQTYTPAQFDYFFLTGALGIIGGFTTEFISKAYDIKESEAEKLAKSQTGTLIVKLADGQNLPEPDHDASSETLSYHLGNARPYLHVADGGSLTIASAKNFPVLKDKGLSAIFLKLEANSMLAPIFTADSSHQLFYVTKGSGRVQIVGLNGKKALEAEVQTGQVFVVPRFFAVAMVADEEGLEYFSVTTSSEPWFVPLAGETSVWEKLSQLVLQAAFNVDLGLTELFKYKITKGTIIVPPKK